MRVQFSGYVRPQTFRHDNGLDFLFGQNTSVSRADIPLRVILTRQKIRFLIFILSLFFSCSFLEYSILYRTQGRVTVIRGENFNRFLHITRVLLTHPRNLTIGLIIMFTLGVVFATGTHKFCLHARVQIYLYLL